MSLAAKLDVASLEVKVTTSESSFVVAPSATALEPSVAVIAMVGATLSCSPVELSGSGVIIAGSIGEGVGSHINGRCACCTWRKSSGVDGRASGREIADRTPRDSDIACGKVRCCFAGSKSQGKRCVIGGRAIGDRVRTIGSGDSDGGHNVIVGPVELGGGGVVIAGSVREGVGSHIDRGRSSCTWRKSSGVDGRASGREIADRASRDSDVACGKSWWSLR